jgi:hypothetical protein
VPAGQGRDGFEDGVGSGGRGTGQGLSN